MKNKKIYKKLIILIIIASIITFFFIEKKESWIAFYYPDKNNLLVHEQSQELYSYDECIQWIKIKSYDNTNYDYECGLNCRIDGRLPYICEKTIR